MKPCAEFRFSWLAWRARSSAAVYQGYRGTVRDLDMLGRYSITQEVTPARLDHYLIPRLLQAIHAFKQAHSGQEPSSILIRSSGVIDVE
jgi:hypothetical protein